MDLNIYVTADAIEKYKKANIWKDFLNVEITGIATLSANELHNGGKAYNLNGTVADDGYRGIMIKNGKKVLRK